MKLVLESPCGAPDPAGFLRNRRYALWCMHVLAVNGNDVFASHVSGPMYLDDRDPIQRERGMRLTEAFTDDSCIHVMALDLGRSHGMQGAVGRFPDRRFGSLHLKEQRFAVPAGINCIELHPLAFQGAWAAFERGEWPPCTPGFEIGGAL